MNPQEKKFVIILSVITAACSAGLYFWASSASTRYDEAKTSYEEVSTEINKYNNLQLSPTRDNIASKEKNINNFDVESNKLITELRKYGSEPVTNTDAQAFTDKLVKEVAEVKEALKKAAEENGATKEVELPDGFFLGFEKYADTPAKQGATGILSYQLDAISELTRALAAAKPASIMALYRETLAEETGKEETPAKDSIYRALPIELSFTGSEKTLRSLLDATQNSKTHFYMIRSMRVTNEKQTPPLASEARFETAATDDAGNKDAPAASPFGEFVLPGEPAEGENAKKEPAKSMTSEIILKEVLGGEKIQVFMRIDIVRFHPAPAAKTNKKP